VFQTTLVQKLLCQGKHLLISNALSRLELTVYKLPGVVGDIAKILGVDMAIAIEDTAVEENNETDGKMNDLINIPEEHENPSLVDDGGNNFNPASEDFGPTMNKQPTPTQQLAKVPMVVIVEPTAVPASSQWSKRIHKQVQKYVPAMKGKSYEYAATQISSKEFEPQIVEMVLTQLTLKAAIKMWGNNDTKSAAKTGDRDKATALAEHIQASSLERVDVQAEGDCTRVSHILNKETHRRD